MITNLNTKGAKKLTKSELKQIAGGGGHELQCAILCFLNEDGTSSCSPNQDCLPFDCGLREPGYRCQ